MPTFTYTARDAKGALKNATIDAPDRDEVASQLRKLRLTVRPREEGAFFCASEHHILSNAGARGG